MILNCEFTPVPRIILSDENLSSTDKLLMGLIISLTLNKGYCFATNKYLAKSMNASKRTINYSLANLKRERWIIIKNINNMRKIYLNPKRGLTINADEVASGCISSNAVNCNYNKNNEYINNYKNKYTYLCTDDVPKWMSNPEICELKSMGEYKRCEIENMLEQYREDD